MNPSSLVDVLRFRAEHQTDQRVFTSVPDGETENGFLTYGELDRRARSIAGWLQSAHPKGARALLIYSNPLEFICAFFGCLFAGVLAVPAQPPSRSRPSQRIRSIAADAQPSVILTTADLLSKLEYQQSQFPDMALLPVQTTEKISIESGVQWRDPGITSGELAFLQYTSGSTATPKGVMVSHGNLMHNLAHIQYAWENTAECINGTWLPAFHDMGLIEGILQPLYCGYPSYIMQPLSFLQHPVRWLRMITKYRVTNSGGPNSAFDLCVRKVKPEQLEDLDLSSWSFCYNGSEPVRKQTLEQFFLTFRTCGLRWQAIHPGYGLAEATLLVSGGRRLHEPVFCTLEEEALSKNEVLPSLPLECGTRTLVASGPVHSDFFEVAIVDPESQRRCHADRIGEIWLKSSSVAQGYWKKSAETDHTFRAYESETGEGPYLRTGDLGFIKDNELFVTGRLKDIIIVSGRNHYPQDIELTSEQAHSAIRSSCSTAFVIDEEGEQKLIIVCEINRESVRRADRREIVGAIRQAVAEEHEISVDAVYLFRPGTIPKTSSGKIQRQICKKMMLAGELERLTVTQPIASETIVDLNLRIGDESPAC